MDSPKNSLLLPKLSQKGVCDCNWIHSLRHPTKHQIDCLGFVCTQTQTPSKSPVVTIRAL